MQADEKTYQETIADCQAERGKADAEVALCEERDAMMQVVGDDDDDVGCGGGVAVVKVEVEVEEVVVVLFHAIYNASSAGNRRAATARD